MSKMRIYFAGAELNSSSGIWFTWKSCRDKRPASCKPCHLLLEHRNRECEDLLRLLPMVKATELNPAQAAQFPWCLIPALINRWAWMPLHAKTRMYNFRAVAAALATLIKGVVCVRVVAKVDMG